MQRDSQWDMSSNQVRHKKVFLMQMIRRRGKMENEEEKRGGKVEARRSRRRMIGLERRGGRGWIIGYSGKTSPIVKQDT